MTDTTDPSRMVIADSASSRGWRTRRFASCATLVSEKNRPDLRLLSVFLNRGVIPYGEGGGQVHKPSVDLTGYQVVRAGNLVLNNQQAWRGSVGVSTHEGIISPAYLVFSLCRELTPEFSNYLFQSRPMVEQYVVASKGVGDIQRDIYLPWLKNVSVPLPPPEEQAAIVRFLDYADRRIRRYVWSKQKLIKLLEEQKQAIIYRAVTSGVDSSAQLVDEQESFIDERPEHWRMVRAKNLFHEVEPPIPQDAEMVTCFRDGEVTLRKNRRTTGFTNAIKELGYQGIYPGQLVLHSMDAFAGAIGISDSKGKCSPEYVICEAADEDVWLPYYGLLLRTLALRGLFVVLCPSVRERAPRVRYSHFGSFRLPLPPKQEQVDILAFIDSECNGIDAELRQTRRRIALALEFQQRLVADAVTGKLDVREAAETCQEEIDSISEDVEVDAELEETPA